MEPQQQQPIYDPTAVGSYGHETAPMETAYGGGAAADDGYQYDANSAFSYDLDPAQNYSTEGGPQYDDSQQQPIYEPTAGEQYAAPREEYYPPQQQQQPNAYLDNDGGQQQQYRPQYEVQPDYKYQPEPEYEYKPYQGGQQRAAAAKPVAQQPKPSNQDFAPVPQSTQRAVTTPAEPRGSARPAPGAAAAKPSRVVPQSRAPTAAASASLSDRKQ